MRERAVSGADPSRTPPVTSIAPDSESGEAAPVRIKGVSDGLCVTLDPDQPFEHLQAELLRLFTPLKHLAVNARVVFDLGVPDGHEDLVERLGELLKAEFGVAAVGRIPKKRAERTEGTRRRDLEGAWHHHRSDVLMLTGRVRSGQKVTARRHLVILGDVNPGGEVVAGGDILVMGALGGTAAAGQPDRQASIILALDFRPTQIQIGPVVAAGLPASPRKFPEYAYMEGGNIVVEDYLEANPFGRMPWPEVR